MPATKRACQARNPLTCPYHRNGVLAEGYRNAAMVALDTNNTEAYMSNMEKAKKFEKLQERIDAGIETALQESREAIAKEFSHKPAYAPKAFSTDTLSLNAANWQNLKDRAEKRELDLTFDSTSVDAMGNVTVNGLKIKGEHNDVLWARAAVRDMKMKEREAMFRTEAGMRQHRPSNMNFYNEGDSRLVAATEAKRSGRLSPIDFDEDYIDPDDDSVDLREHERERLRRTQGVPSARSVYAGFNPNSMSPRDQREHLGLDDSFDTPTEHVATIPSFDDFKRMFGFGKKK